MSRAGFSFAFAVSLSVPHCVSSDSAAATLNKIYLGYDRDDNKSLVGVTVRFLPHDDNYTMFYCGQGCYNGFADCRVSASILNDKVMFNLTSGQPAATMGRMLGVAFNQTMVEQTYGKCSYIYDGSSDLKYNMGCGCGAPITTPPCADNSAFGSRNPQTGKLYKPTDPQLAGCNCDHQVAEKNGTHCNGFFEGPGFFQGAGNHRLRHMMAARLDDQGSDPVKIQTWNEVVLDGQSVLAELSARPDAAISALVWMKTGQQSHDAVAQMFAKAAAARWEKEYSFKAPIPIVALNTQVDIRCGDRGPFEDYSPAPPPSPGPMPSPKACSRFSHALVNTDLDGGVVATGQATAADGCCALCDAQKGCLGFAFFQGVCYMKDSNRTAHNCGRTARIRMETPALVEPSDSAMVV